MGSTEGQIRLRSFWDRANSGLLQTSSSCWFTFASATFLGKCTEMLSAAAPGTIRQVFRCSGRLAVAFAHRQRAIPFIGLQELRVEQAGMIPNRCSPDAWMDAPRTTKTRITKLCALMRAYAHLCALMRAYARFNRDYHTVLAKVVDKNARVYCCCFANGVFVGMCRCDHPDGRQNVSVPC